MTDTITETEWLHRQIGNLTAGLSTLSARVERLEAAAKPAPAADIGDLEEDPGIGACEDSDIKLPMSDSLRKATTHLLTSRVAAVIGVNAFIGEESDGKYKAVRLVRQIRGCALSPRGGVP